MKKGENSAVFFKDVVDAPGIPRETRLGRRVEEDLECDTVRGFSWLEALSKTKIHCPL